jgi:multidrug resistance protein, MATE family
MCCTYLDQDYRKVSLFIPIMDEPLLSNGVEKTGGLGESLVVNEIRKQLYLAGPLIASWLLQNLVQMISVMFVGHLGELALSSASIATSFAGVTGFSLLVCICKLILFSV